MDLLSQLSIEMGTVFLEPGHKDLVLRLEDIPATAGLCHATPPARLDSSAILNPSQKLNFSPQCDKYNRIRSPKRSPENSQDKVTKQHTDIY